MDLILLEVSVFQYHFDTVTQCQDRGTEQRVFLCLRDLTRSREFSDQRFVGDCFLIGFYRNALRLHKIAEQFFICRKGDTFFFRTGQADNDISVTDHILYIFVDLFDRNSLCNLVDQCIFGFDAGNISSFGKVADIFIGESAVTLFVAVIVERFVVFQHVDTGAVIL